MKISVLTPTYNRANLLDRLYASILINEDITSSVEVEWLVMDDGSQDSTKTVVDQYVKENIINVKYYYQENQGKMVAINNLVKKATGDIIIECDSDDYFTKDAFRIVKDTYEEYKTKENIYAFVYLKYDQNGKNMGNNFPQDNYESTMFNLYFKEGITGEKALVYNANIRKQYEYKIENNEKFVTEARLQHELDLKYKVICFNKPIMICEYQKEGYTRNINKQFTQSPFGYYKYFEEMFNQNLKGVTHKKRMYIYKHYILFSVLTNQKHPIKNVKGTLNKIAVALLFIPGKIMTKARMK